MSDDILDTVRENATEAVVDAATSVAEQGLEGIADAFADIIGGEDPLPKVNYTFSALDAGDAHWLVRRMHLVEALSEPYLLTLNLVTDEVGADTELLLGAYTELTIDRADVIRTVYGVIHLVEFIGVSADMLEVRVEIVPAFHLLSQRVDTRLWQNAKVTDVVKEVLEGALVDFEREVDDSGLTAEYPTREYIVQYHESDFDFVSRLLESEGIVYWFDHERGDGKEVMVLEDSNDNFIDLATLDDNPELRIVTDRPENIEVESLRYLDWTRELTSTAVYQRIFDWLDPTQPVEATAPAEGEPDADDRGLRREVYHHGRFVEDDPDPRTVRKLVHRSQRDKLARGFGNVTGFFPGRKFAVGEHQRADLDREYLLRRVVHTGDCPDVVMQEDSQAPRYQNRFECLVFDPDKPFRPPRVTPRPRIYGPQTAIVTGPDGEEIHTDDHGRIKVRFDWDRVHTLTDDTSMWIRVAHNWAGPGYGTFFVPRIGMEVLVEFLEGDPDKPLVVGCVYNGDNAISVGVPDNKTQSTIRTRSSPQSDGYNELRFEDAAGSEEIFIHAQKDFNETVEHNHSTTVHNNHTNTVDGNDTETVHGEQSLTVHKNRTVHVKGSHSITVDGSEANNGVSGSKLAITGDYKVDATNTIEVQAPTHIHLTCGGSTIKMTPGKIELTAGGMAKIVLDANALMESAAHSKTFLDGNALVKSSGGSQVLFDSNACMKSNGGSKVLLDGNALMESNGKSKVLLDGSALVHGVATATLDGPTSTLQGKSGSVAASSSGVDASGPVINIGADGLANITGAPVKLN